MTGRASRSHRALSLEFLEQLSISQLVIYNELEQMIPISFLSFSDLSAPDHVGYEGSISYIS